MMPTIRQVYRVPLAMALATTLLLSACGSSYQAPILEQGERRVVSAPIIVDSSTPQSSLRVENSTPVAVSSSTGSRPAAVVSSRSTQGTSQSRPVQSRSIPDSYRVRAGDTLFSIAY